MSQDDEDRKGLIDTLEYYKSISQFEIYAYCLMRNHVHLLIKEVEEPISKIMKRINVSYSIWYNKRYERYGYLFQDRFKSEPVDDNNCVEKEDFMKRILVTGGTVFVSKYVAKYFKSKGHEVYVLNRGTKPQLENVNLICADRNNLGDCLQKYCFDAIIDVCGYNREDIKNILDAVGAFKDYIFISSSAVYPETNLQPFSENQSVGGNSIWGKYGQDKIEAEKYLFSRFPNAYILRPPYLYGPMQNVYREPFVFECALENRKFYIPNDGTMKLQFFHVEDLCKVIDNILEKHPKEHIYNVGNSELVDINTFVELCYKVVGVPLEKVYVTSHNNQRDYFSFYDYEYSLDVSRQANLLGEEKDLFEGLKESYEWFKDNPSEVVKKDYINFIKQNFE
ncbi:NAD-dependent epimerase/dehydratase family protein [Clostridium manihotivorum]|uniref:NAD-dependent epimerase/dehydratase family protein n=1 Tax=Clostridium manihotivorum TaxID=2320868 RepID=UPI0013E40708|nr:NAD-dependent epimerase/dehydratase family protein [Clostridium manihotivorum]